MLLEVLFSILNGIGADRYSLHVKNFATRRHQKVTFFAFDLDLLYGNIVNQVDGLTLGLVVAFALCAGLVRADLVLPPVLWACQSNFVVVWQ